ncbi:MAG: hypothetical protein HYT34_00020, partial [Candidatus Ryanbacteria bacterium]|nr:hypothetical protein [Candidatus Ryanbacteria bacterium]
MKKCFKNFHITLASIITTFFVATVLFTFAAWQNPTQAPPGGNVDAPINVGPTAQTKAGPLTLDMQATATPALTVTASVNVGSGIQLSNTSSGGRSHRIYAGSDSALHFYDVTAARERLTLFP